MNKFAWGIVTVLIIAVVVILFLTRKATSTVKPDLTKLTTGAYQTVIYSNSGFSPSSITINVGESVVFKNESNVGMWVASAPHPAHTAYQEFDAQKGIAKGEDYVFTFTKAGVWKYHNHLIPSDTGTVIVK